MTILTCDVHLVDALAPAREAVASGDCSAAYPVLRDVLQAVENPRPGAVVGWLRSDGLWAEMKYLPVDKLRSLVAAARDGKPHAVRAWWDDVTYEALSSVVDRRLTWSFASSTGRIVSRPEEYDADGTLKPEAERERARRDARLEARRERRRARKARAA